MTDRKKFEIEYSRTFSESSFDYSGELESVFYIGDDGEYQDPCTRAAFDGWCIAWQAATKAAVPEGYKVVPINPTEEMITAWYESPYSEDGTENMLSGYEAMLAAAPEVK